MEFLIGLHCKKHAKTFWSLQKRQKLLMFLKGVFVAYIAFFIHWDVKNSVIYSAGNSVYSEISKGDKLILTYYVV